MEDDIEYLDTTLLEERERAAYAEGRVAEAALLAQLIDQIELQKTLAKQ